GNSYQCVEFKAQDNGGKPVIAIRKSTPGSVLVVHFQRVIHVNVVELVHYSHHSGPQFYERTQRKADTRARGSPITIAHRGKFTRLRIGVHSQVARMHTKAGRVAHQARPHIDVTVVGTAPVVDKLVGVLEDDLIPANAHSAIVHPYPHRQEVTFVKRIVQRIAEAGLHVLYNTLCAVGNMHQVGANTMDNTFDPWNLVGGYGSAGTQSVVHNVGRLIHPVGSHHVEKLGRAWK